MPKNDYWKLSAYESAKLIKDGSILAEDLVSSCIERVNQTNNKINAIEAETDRKRQAQPPLPYEKTCYSST